MRKPCAEQLFEAGPSQEKQKLPRASCVFLLFVVVTIVFVAFCSFLLFAQICCFVCSDLFVCAQVASSTHSASQCGDGYRKSIPRHLNSLRGVASGSTIAMRGSSSEPPRQCAAPLLSIKAAQFTERCCMLHRKNHAWLHFSARCIERAMRGSSSAQ